MAGSAARPPPAAPLQVALCVPRSCILYLPRSPSAAAPRALVRRRAAGEHGQACGGTQRAPCIIPWSYGSAYTLLRQLRTSAARVRSSGDRKRQPSRMAAVQEPSRVAFLGVHAWKGRLQLGLDPLGSRRGLERPSPCSSLPLPAAHEAVRWWGAAYSEGEQAVSEGAPTRLDVFGVARADVALPLACGLAWQGLRPGSDTRVASHPVVDAVVCSGVGPNDVQVWGSGARRRCQRAAAAASRASRTRPSGLTLASPLPPQVVKDSRRAGKAMFVESLVSGVPAGCGPPCSPMQPGAAVCVLAGRALPDSSSRRLRAHSPARCPGAGALPAGRPG